MSIEMDVMSKTFRGPARKDCNFSSEKMAAVSSDDAPRWPSVSGPKVPENNPKLWKTPRLDISSSLAFLRRELASMQLQDRSLHKQLLALNASIRDLKTSLNESWESDDYQTYNQSSEDNVDGESLETSIAQVAHAKQDSGILTDEENDEERDTFERRTVNVRGRQRAKSVPSAIFLDSGINQQELDVNQNIICSIKGNHVTPARTRSHTVGEVPFHRVTSMPVINEIPGDTRMNSSLSGSTFAVSGYVNRPRSVTETQRFPQAHHRPLSRHDSMPVISNIGRNSVKYVGSEAINKRIHKKFGSFDQVNTRTTTKKPLYKTWRSSSQVSLV